MSAKPCRYGCGKTIIFLGKVEGKAGSTGQFEVENGKITNIEHTYKRCRALLSAQEKTKEEYGDALDSFNITS